MYVTSKSSQQTVWLVHLFFKIKLYWDTAIPLCLHAVSEARVE